MAVVWELPWIGRILGPVTGLVEWLGFEQGWGMFAPDPPVSNRDLVVLLELPSGGALAWELPHLHQLPALRAFLGFRYRSYEHAILYGEGFPACHAALAEYLLRKHARHDPPPRAAAFTYVDRPIAPPGEPEPDVPPARASFFTHRPGEPPPQ